MSNIKVGDTIRIIKGYNGFMSEWAIEFANEGTEFKVLGINQSGSYSVKDKTGRGFNIASVHAELVGGIHEIIAESEVY